MTSTPPPDAPSHDAPAPDAPVPDAPVPDAPPAARRSRSEIAAWICVGAVAAVGVAHAVVGDGVWLLLVWGAYTPLVWLPAYVTLAFGVARRFVPLAVASLVLVLVHLSSVVPQLWLRDPAEAGDRPLLRVVTANGNAGNARPELFLQSLMEHDPDIVCLQELSPPWADAVAQGGLLDEYPHHRMDARDGVWGMALLSRLPFTNVELINMMEARAISAQVEHDGVTIDVLCAHPAPPAGELFESHHEALGLVLAWAEAHAGGPAIALGDFNTTPYSAFSRQLRDHMSDAWELAGATGFGNTWPHNGMTYPPARLDHVYVSASLGVTSAVRGSARGSDHQPVVANVVVRAD